MRCEREPGRTSNRSDVNDTASLLGDHDLKRFARAVEGGVKTGCEHVSERHSTSRWAVIVRVSRLGWERCLPARDRRVGPFADRAKDNQWQTSRAHRLGPE